MKPLHFLFVTASVFLAAVSGSCIKEDLSACRSTNELTLSYKGDGETEIFKDKVRRVEIFVFDSKGNLVYSGVLPQSDVDRAKTVLPTLDPGDYTIVCVGNTHSTRIDKVVVGDFTKTLFGPEAQFGSGTVTGADSLYFASKRFTVTDYDAADVIPFKSAHYKVLVEVLADGVILDALTTLTVTGLSPYTNFAGDVHGDLVHYHPAMNRSSSMMVSRFNIKRNKDFGNTEVVFTTSAGGEVARINVGEFLRDHPEIDVSKHECLIPIRIVFTSAGIEIKVPEWYAQHVNPEF